MVLVGFQAIVISFDNIFESSKQLSKDTTMAQKTSKTIKPAQLHCGWASTFLLKLMPNHSVTHLRHPLFNFVLDIWTVHVGKENCNSYRTAPLWCQEKSSTESVCVLCCDSIVTTYHKCKPKTIFVRFFELCRSDFWNFFQMPQQELNAAQFFKRAPWCCTPQWVQHHGARCLKIRWAFRVPSRHTVRSRSLSSKFFAKFWRAVFYSSKQFQKSLQQTSPTTQI